MITHRCIFCTWWDNTHPYIKTVPIMLSKNAPGICRKHKPGAIAIGREYYGVQPIMDADEFCGEFKEDR